MLLIVTPPVDRGAPLAGYDAGSLEEILDEGGPARLSEWGRLDDFAAQPDEAALLDQVD